MIFSKKNIQRLGILQQEQIELGRKSGLSTAQIKLYAKPRYNFLQMQEIRLALEAGASPKEIKMNYRENVSHQAMEKLRQEGDYQKDNFSLAPYYIVGVLSILLIIGFIIGSYFRIQDDLYINFIHDEIVLSSAQELQPFNYVVNYHPKGQLSVLNNLGADEEGVLVYRLERGNERIYHSLKIRRHDIAPIASGS